MDIRFVSSLTPEDEIRVAEGLFSAVSAVLDQLSIAYTLRIEVPGATVLRHSHAPGERAVAPAVAAVGAGAPAGSAS